MFLELGFIKLCEVSGKTLDKRLHVSDVTKAWKIDLSRAPFSNLPDVLPLIILPFQIFLMFSLVVFS